MLKRLLLTGAAGGTGQRLRPLPGRPAAEVVLSDLAAINDPAALYQDGGIRPLRAPHRQPTGLMTSRRRNAVAIG